MLNTNRNLSYGRYIVIVVHFLLVVFTFISIILLSSFTSNATSLTPDFEVRVSDMLELSVSTCNSTNNSLVEVDVEPSVAGTFKSNCQDVSVNTNNPGYSLLAKATSSNPNYQSGAITNSLLYINPTTVTPTPAIPSTTNTIASPNTLSNNTWGFAVEGLNQTDTSSNLNTTPNFDTTYTIDGQNNKFASLPTTDTIIYRTESFPSPVDTLTFFYATKLTPSTMAGSYTTTITYTAIGEVIPPAPKTCKNHEYAPECIEFTVDVGTTGTYSIPTNGVVTGHLSTHTYDWDIYVDGYLTTACANGNCTGTSSNDSNGITITNLSDGKHRILIVPHNDPIPGWGNAFGHYAGNEGANVAENKHKMFSLNAPLTTMAFSPKTTESTTNASYMFALTFTGCRNMTTTATYIDTYKLPSTITDFSFFMYYAHGSNSKLTEPIDLSPLSDWIHNNVSIRMMTHFLSGTHHFNTNMLNAINLVPVTNWFYANESMRTLNHFLGSTHNTNTLITEPIDLSPIRNWFSNNTSISSFTHFLGSTHYENVNLLKPINLMPLSDWFPENRIVSNNLSGFYILTHYHNIKLDLHGQTLFPNWIKTMKDSAGKPLWNTGTDNTNYSFFSSFYLRSYPKSDDTGEPRFEDGDVLSSVGSPDVILTTYTNRSGFQKANPNW